MEKKVSDEAYISWIGIPFTTPSTESSLFPVVNSDASLFWVSCHLRCSLSWKSTLNLNLLHNFHECSLNLRALWVREYQIPSGKAYAILNWRVIYTYSGLRLVTLITGLFNSLGLRHGIRGASSTYLMDWEDCPGTENPSPLAASVALPLSVSLPWLG